MRKWMKTRNTPILCTAMEKLRDEKATGDGDLPGDVLKLLREGGFKIMTQLFNSTHKTGARPNEFLEVTMTALKKKPKATKCSNHHTISLIVHTAKTEAGLLT
jgi:hypothetical protein